MQKSAINIAAITHVILINLYLGFVFYLGSFSYFCLIFFGLSWLQGKTKSFFFFDASHATVMTFRDSSFELKRCY